MNLISSSLFLFAAVLAAPVPSASAAVSVSAAAEPEWAQASSSQQAQSEEGAYAAGTRAMNESRWSDAVANFELVSNAKGKRGEAALYWKAYALTRLGKLDLANATCLQLQTQYEGSRWNRDCAALPLAQSSGFGGLPSPNNAALTSLRGQITEKDAGQKDPDAEIKMLALNSLLHRDPAQAIPLLRGILAGDQSDLIKRHALFVLAQSHSPDADALMHDLVLGKTGNDLQRQSIQACGVYQGRRCGDALAEAYRTSSDPKIKHAVISALFVSGNDQRLVDLARNEKDLELKRSIVSQLALMNGKAASDYMLELLK